MPDEPKTINTGGGAYIGGNVISGRDTVMRDQINITNQQDITIEAFRALLSEFRQHLTQAGLDSETAEVIEGDFKVVEQQAAKDTPSGSIIKNKLQSIKGLLGDTASAAGSVDKIMQTLNKLMEFAGPLFP